jgi:hypothetical protein
MEYVADVHYFPDRAYRDSAHEASGCEMSFVHGVAAGKPGHVRYAAGRD